MNDVEQTVLRQMQQDLPITSRPFHVLAENAGLSEGEFLSQVKALKERGVIRRVNAVLKHRLVGFQANALCVWQVDEDRIDEVGNLFASMTEVTHCYERETYPEWQYNLYTMVHALTRRDCEEIIQKMGELAGVKEHLVFYSTKELKKSTMRYF